MRVQERPLVIWRISDNKPGHDAQTLGLASAVCKLAGCDVREIRAPSAPPSLANLLAGSFSAGGTLPDPNLIIGAGHGTHLPMLAARRARGGRTVVLMKPSLPAAWFDLCLIPEHDNPPAKKNILPTRGALNTISPSPGKDTRRGLILLGGPSRHHDWSEDQLVEKIRLIAESSAVHWTLTDSPRTPPSTRRRLKALEGNSLVYRAFAETTRAWVEEALAVSSLTWVTEDSMTMIYEALTSGSAVGILELPVKRQGRISRAARRLIEEDMVTAFADWRTGGNLRPPAVALHEADRCARLVLERFELPAG